VNFFWITCIMIDSKFIFLRCWVGLAKHFDRDPETNEVLWFPAPPVDAPRKATPKYSLAYLHFLAARRKREAVGDEDEDEDGMDVDGDEDPEALAPVKRARWEGLPSVTETLRAAVQRTGAGV
jgi:chromatin structure-remodeling complex subunit RSC1/2